MRVFGVSQTSGVERRLSVERGVDGIVLAITDEAGGKERARVLVPADDLLATVTDPTPGGSTVEGVSPAHGTAMRLGVEIRRNEVWIEVRGVAGEGPDAAAVADVAVGFDDFQDALEGAISRGR